LYRLEAAGMIKGKWEDSATPRRGRGGGFTICRRKAGGDSTKRAASSSNSLPSLGNSRRTGMKELMIHVERIVGFLVGRGVAALRRPYDEWLTLELSA